MKIVVLVTLLILIHVIAYAEQYHHCFSTQTETESVLRKHQKQQPIFIHITDLSAKLIRECIIDDQMPW